jgi:AraC-like DNA-binding protein
VDIAERTASVPDAGGAAAWQGALARWLAPLRVAARECPGGPPPVARLGYLTVLPLAGGPLRLSRTARDVAAAPADRLAVVLQTDGVAALAQDGRAATAHPGDLAVLDPRRPFSLEQRHPFRAVLFVLPARAVGVRAADVAEVTGRALTPADGGVAALLAPFLHDLGRDAGRLAPDSGDRLAGIAADLLATLVGERAAGGAAGDSLPTRIRGYIDRHLADPELSPERIAAAHRISVRYLHKLFAREGITVGGLVRRRRVEECGWDLARRGAAGSTISAVAQRWGFPNPAHFSRSFKALYGVPPRQWRPASEAESRQTT